MKEKVKNDSNINIKQILIIIFFILVIIIGIYANNYNENNNTNEQSIISYTVYLSLSLCSNNLYSNKDR